MKRRYLSAILSVAVLVIAVAYLLAASVRDSANAAAPAPEANTTVPGAAPDRARIAAALQSAPVMFIENVGQFDMGARFQVRGGNTDLWLAEDALWITLVETPPQPSSIPGRKAYPPVEIEEGQPRRGVALKLSFPGANPHPRLEPFNRLETHVSYYIGNDPEKWHPDVPVWGGVRYRELYPGIDLEVTSENGRLVQRMVARPGANLDAVRLRVEGAEALTVDGDRLRLTTALGDFTLPLLTVEGARPNGQPSTMNLERGAFEVTSPFASAPLLPGSSPQTDGALDLAYSTFLGGSGLDWGYDIAVDGSGNIYVTGLTYSSDFPTTAGAFDTTSNGNMDAFLAYVAGQWNLLGSVFFGGADVDWSYALGVDESGNVYVTGSTRSSDFPITGNAYQNSLKGPEDAFVMLWKWNQLVPGTFTLEYSTYLGGSGNDGGYGIDCDESGNCSVTGSTNSTDFQTTAGAFQTIYGGGRCGEPPDDYDCYDGFVCEVNPTGTDMNYCTYLGGSGNDGGYGIDCDESGNCSVTGSTNSSNFHTTPGAFDPTYGGGTCGTEPYTDPCSDAFVTKFNPDGTALLYSTYLGGDGCDDGASGIVCDESGVCRLAGWTTCAGFHTTPGAFDTTYDAGTCGTEPYTRPCHDGFVCEVNATGTDMDYCTFLGGDGCDDWGDDIAVDGSGNAHVTGFTDGPFPTTEGAFDTIYNGGGDAFVAKLNPAGTDLAYGSFLGGTGSDGGYGIAVDVLGNVYVAGYTDSSDFPTTSGAYDNTYNGGGDAFVTKLAAEAGPSYSISGRVSDVNNNAFSGVTVSDDTGHTAVTDNNGNYTLSALTAGTYTVTPSKSGYAFLPASRTVNVPPDATGQNFIILAPPVSTTLTPGIAATLTYTDTQGLPTQLDFPANAVSQATTLVLTPTVASAGTGVAFAGHAFELNAYQAGDLQPGFPFGASVPVTIGYSDDDIQLVADESELVLQRWTGSEWQDAAQTCDPASSYTRDEANNTLSVPICHLSLFGLFGPGNRVYLPLILKNY